MKKTLRKILFLSLVVLGLNASAQNQPYWKEGFEPDQGCDLTTTNPTSITPTPTTDVTYYFNTNAGSWWARNLYRTTGTGCPTGNNHVRLRNMGTTGTFDSGTLVTPVVNFGIQEFHFSRARASRTYTIWVTNDTSATTTNWYQPIPMKSWANTTCQDTTVVIGSATAKRLKLVVRAGLDYDIDSVWVTSFSAITPVKFSGISASEANSFVKVNWNIESEVNTSTYAIERSTNGNDFVAVGTLTANRAKTYSWIDKSASTGSYIYRIKAIDNNGTYMYSNSVRISVGGKNKTELTIAPNPVTNSRVNIQLNGISSGDYKVNVYSLNGALLYTTTLNSQGTSVAKSIDLPSNVKTGTYTLEVVNTNFKSVKTILVN